MVIIHEPRAAAGRRSVLTAQHGTVGPVVLLGTAWRGAYCAVAAVLARADVPLHVV